MVERTDERPVLLVVPDRTEETLLGIIRTNIPPRNIINSRDDDGNVIENVLNDHEVEFERHRKHFSDLWGGFLISKCHDIRWPERILIDINHDGDYVSTERDYNLSLNPTSKIAVTSPFLPFCPVDMLFDEIFSGRRMEISPVLLQISTGELLNSDHFQCRTNDIFDFYKLISLCSNFVGS
ncbi:hypothetical protein RF11_10813 [Thelohanellus kitauei]|uniref:Uncharacterized protein n=1 Tax=Thelohanellus kitauei TaxID=669202 RepID=A0A0C2MWB0_THEKT|nr:hypothetical protein RF11_10813 [Thelohanellus kitauei]